MTDLTLELERRFEASPERVFDAWTGPEWCRWLPPAQSLCEIVEQDCVAGGAFRVRMTMPDGRVIEILGRYVEVARPDRLAMTWTGSYNNHETRITLTFRTDGSGTLMTLRQEGFADPGLVEGYRAGWTGPGGSFEKLADLLAEAR